MLFYKYASEESGLRILEGLCLKVTPPNEFNDPFELTPRSKLKITLRYMLDLLRTDEEAFLPAYDDMVRNESYPHSFQKFLSDLPRMLPLKFKEFRMQYREALITQDLQSLDEGSKYMGLLCVSRPNNSIPMWSHYANHHRGMAFGLDMKHRCFTHGFSTEFAKVRYRRTRYPVEALLQIGEPELLRQLKAVISTKSPDWKYEEEHRAIYRLDELISRAVGEDGKQLYFLNIDGTAIREIIFGCRSDSEIKQKIWKEFKRKPKTFGHVKLLQCKRHGSKFELEVIPA
jgi:hypothetical protein